MLHRHTRRIGSPFSRHNTNHNPIFILNSVTRPMAFVAHLPCASRPPSRHPARCAAKSPHQQSNSKDIPLIDDAHASTYLRSLNRQYDHQVIGQPSQSPPVHRSTEKNPQTDVWDTLIDDHTVADNFFQHFHPTATIECGHASMAAKPSSVPQPESTASPNEPKRKRGRGRPKGSMAKKISPTPPPSVSPFMSAVREDLRRRSIAAMADSSFPAFQVQSEGGINWDKVQLSAPNGLPDEAQADLIQELLPFLAQQENEENRIVSEEESRIKQLVSLCYTQFSSVHRTSDRNDNLKPFKLRRETEHDCNGCEGTGMTVCEYCEGQGFVDLGENAEKFNPVFGDNEFDMPTHVMGNIYHCPLCGGLQKERCVKCFGTGTEMMGPEDLLSGASSVPKENRAWKAFDMDELLRQEADRIEIGLDGTIIMRAKPRGRPKKAKTQAAERKPEVSRRQSNQSRKAVSKDIIDSSGLDKKEDPDGVAQDTMGFTEDFEGMEQEELEESMSDGDQRLNRSAGTARLPPGRPVGRSTDFVNTTDYRVGRQLQRRTPSVTQGFTESTGEKDTNTEQGRYEVDQFEAGQTWYDDQNVPEGA